ncbi:MAG: helix-turn-helix domain-containing protein [Bryobacteraceae bacterium]|nr:helix-turn-helix domain-containing protein [Bryobacteraceae bacterium]
MLALKQVMPRRLVRLRESHRLSQRALARQIGVAVSTVNCLESGFARDLRLATLLKLCERFQVSPDFLLGFETARAPHRLDFGPCPSCGSGRLPGEIHSAAQCIYCLHCAGDSEEILAAKFGICLPAVRGILDHEFEARRRRRN